MKTMLLAMACFASVGMTATAGDERAREAGYRLERLFAIAKLPVKVGEARVTRLLAGQSARLENLAGGDGGSIYRLWVFGGWGDKLYTVKVSGEGVAEVAKTDSQQAYRVSVLKDPPGALAFRAGLDDALLDPLPIQPQRPTASYEDDALYLIERCQGAGDYRWAIRSLDLTTHESLVKFVALQNRMAKLGWKLRD